MRQTDRRQTDVGRASSLNAPTLGAGHNKGGGDDHNRNSKTCNALVKSQHNYT